MKFRAPKLVKELCFADIGNNSNATVRKQLLRPGPNTNCVLWACLRDSEASAQL